MVDHCFVQDTTVVDIEQVAGAGDVPAVDKVVAVQQDAAVAVLLQHMVAEERRDMAEAQLLPVQ